MMDTRELMVRVWMGSERERAVVWLRMFDGSIGKGQAWMSLRGKGHAGKNCWWFGNISAWGSHIAGSMESWRQKVSRKIAWSWRRI